MNMNANPLKNILCTWDLKREAKTQWKENKDEKTSYWGRGWGLLSWEQNELFAWVFPREEEGSILKTAMHSP